MGELQSLQHLTLTRNQLTSIPPEIYSLSGLRSLDLSYNSLTDLSPEISQLSQIENLNLEYNAIADFPSSIGQLTNLTEIDIVPQVLPAAQPVAGSSSPVRNPAGNPNASSETPPKFSESYRRALARIQAAKESKATMLTLADGNLQQLPPEIGELADLEV